MSLDDYIDHLAHDGLEERLEFLYPDEAKRNEVRPRYLERLEYELSIIKKMKFPGYFLIVQEFINWSKTHGRSCGTGPRLRRRFTRRLFAADHGYGSVAL